MNDDIITKLRHLSGTKVKVSEFVELKRVFVVCLRLQLQESLGGVFHERFIRFDAVVRETVFVIAVDFVSIRVSVVVGRTPQIDGVCARYATRCWEDGQSVFAVFAGENGGSHELYARRVSKPGRQARVKTTNLFT